jgi:hypothetical protein
MGLCVEFGPRIQQGCDHPMVAGHECCSCAKCHAVCTGKFSGCREVWARGPIQLDLSPRNSSENEAGAGETARPSAKGFLRSDPAAVASVLSGDTSVLFPELQVLAQQLSDASGGWPPDGDAESLQATLNALRQQLEVLPGRIESAINDALSKQHGVIMRDVTIALRSMEQ